jgi:hypothetical protein
MSTTPFSDLEAAYELLAQAVDDVGPANDTLFLAKLSIAMVQETGDLAALERAIDIAKCDLATD